MSLKFIFTQFLSYEVNLLEQKEAKYPIDLMHRKQAMAVLLDLCPPLLELERIKVATCSPVQQPRNQSLTMISA